MGLKRQIIALGAIVLAGGTLLPTDEAMAFGQQWRPAPGLGPGNGANFARKPNMPAFRPHSAARPAIARNALSMRRPGYAPRPYAGHYARPFASGQGLATPAYYARPMAGFTPPPGHLAAAYPQSAWAAPFAPMTSPWGHQQMPMFSRQFGWRSAPQPWMAQAPAPRWHDYPARATPRVVQPRPARAAYLPAAGSWRPAAVAPQQFAAGPPTNAHTRRPIGAAARPAMPRNLWRPQVAARTGTRPSGQAFRPKGYGRRQPAGVQLAERAGEGSGFTRDGLPGWVTTYPNDAVEDACNWCSGS